MKFEFGLLTDHEYFSKPQSSMGEMRGGPEALLRRLELELGIPVIETHVIDRLMAYRRCIEESDTVDCFYHRSFEKDTLGVTHILLDWRDEWYLSGWSGVIDSLHASERNTRLAQIVKIEKLARTSVPLGHGQRLNRVLQEFEKGLVTQIDTLILLDRFEYLPHLWQQVVQKIGFTESECIEFKPVADKGSDLYKVQSEVCDILNPNFEANADMVKLSGDDSILALRSSSRDVTARAIAEILQDEAERFNSLVIAEDVGIVLDNALERGGLPRCGFEHLSQFRAISQVIRLSLALMWKPIRPTLLLQFLIHPVGPLSRFVSRSLSSVVSNEPGIGGPAWQETVDVLKQRISETQDDQALAEVAIGQLETQLQYWFYSERYDAREGAPVEALIERCNRCGEWLRKLAHADQSSVEIDANDTEEDEVNQISEDASVIDSVLNVTAEDPAFDPIQEMYVQAYRQYERVFDGLNQMYDEGQKTLSKRELDFLLDEFLSPLPDPSRFGEALHVSGSTHPGAVVEYFDQIIWWDIRSTSRRNTLPWTDEEIEILAANEVKLESEDIRLRRQTESALRPLMNCRSRFLMISHPSSANYMPHLLQTMLKSRFEGVQEFTIEPSFDAATRSALDKLAIKVESLTPKPLPAPAAYWDVSNARLVMREKESYSSLDTLFNTPHAYVIDYMAKLRRSLAGDMRDEQALRGNLAHLVLKQFFEEGPDWHDASKDVLDAFVAERLPKLIDTVGAVFNEPGKRSSVVDLEFQISRALRSLVAHLRTSKVKITRILPEHEVNEPYSFKGVELGGMIDLLIGTDKGELVIDVKWGGEGFRVQQLRENSYLQLATYAYLRKKSLDTKNWPWFAFFIIQTGQIVAPDGSIFPNARVVAPEGDEGIEELWERMNATYGWRRNQLESGNIEVNSTLTETEMHVRPEKVLQTIEPSPFELNGSLLGWRE